MENAILPSWFTLSVILVTGMAAPTADRVSCQAGCYLEGDAASIQCTFNKDLNSTKHNFNVVRYPLGGATGDQQHNIVSDIYVLLCNWDAASKLTCKATDGYFFNYEVSTRLRVEIPVASRNHEGDYACQLVPTDGVQTDTCRLSVLQQKSNLPSDAVVLSNMIIIALGSAVLVLSTSLFSTIFCLCRLLNNFYLLPKPKMIKKRMRMEKKVAEEQELIPYPQTESDSLSGQQKQNKHVLSKTFSHFERDSKSTFDKKTKEQKSKNTLENKNLVDQSAEYTITEQPEKKEKAKNTDADENMSADFLNETDDGNHKDEKKLKDKNKNPEHMEQATESPKANRTQASDQITMISSEEKCSGPNKRILCGLGEAYSSVQTDKQVQVTPDMFGKSSRFKRICEALRD